MNNIYDEWLLLISMDDIDDDGDDDDADDDDVDHCIMITNDESWWFMLNHYD